MFTGLLRPKRLCTEFSFNNREWDFSCFPNEILIETVMGCNLKCPMCPVPSSRTLMDNRRPCHMKPGIFEKIIEEISDMPRFISLYQMGEPLLHRHIFDYIHLCKSKGHQVSLTSNGTLLNEHKASLLVESGLDKITFSIDGFRPETYEKIRVGAKYETVTANIEFLYRLKRKRKSRLIIQIDCIDSDLTHDQIPDMKKFWRTKCDVFNVIPLDDWADQLELPGELGSKKKAFSSEAGSAPSRYPCDLLWNTLAVSAEGNIMYCCHDFKLRSGLPNVMDMPIKQIWQEHIALERKKHVQGIIDSEPCIHCDAWRSRKRKTGFAGMIKRFIPLYYQTMLKKVKTSFR